MKFRTLKDLDFAGKKVLLRVDFNVPLDEEGNVVDDKRIRETLPTIKYLLARDAKIIIISHLGRPKGQVVEKLKMNNVAKRLAELLGQEVVKLDSCVGTEVKQRINEMKPKDVTLLENVRFYEGEKSKDEKVKNEFAKQLADLGDIYVNDAFANCHRDHASMTGIPKFLPSCAGLLVQKEVELLVKAIEEPERPFIVIAGGVKADKVNTISKLVEKADKILIGGSITFIFLKAKGYEVGNFKVDLEGFEGDEEKIKELLETQKIILPVDVVIADKFEANANSKIVNVENIANDWIGLDVGPETIKYYQNILKQAKTIVWFGPIGVFEWEKFANGTKELAEFLAGLEATVIIGGGDSATAVDKLGLSYKMTYVSTGGGASLMLFEGKELPAIKALEESVNL